MPTQREPFVRGWRAVAVNVLSGSVIATALSSALVGTATTQVVQQAPPAAGVRVQVGAVPVSVGWPRGADTAFLELDLSAADSRTAVLEGDRRVAAVESCSAPWTSAGTCPGTRLLVSAGGGLARVVLQSARAHLKVSAVPGGAAAGALVVRSAAGA